MECTCQTPGKTEDFLIAHGPDGRVAWWARKDCPLHGIKDITPADAEGEIECQK